MRTRPELLLVSVWVWDRSGRESKKKEKLTLVTVVVGECWEDVCVWRGGSVWEEAICPGYRKKGGTKLRGGEGEGGGELLESLAKDA